MGLEEELAVLVARGEISEKEILKAIGETLSISKILFELDDKLTELEKDLDFIQILSDENDRFNGDGVERIGHCNAFINPETLIFRKQTYDKLSSEAKTIISMVLNSSPDDFRRGRWGCHFWKSRTPNSECRIVKKLLREVIHQYIGWTYKVIDLTFEELKGFIRELEKNLR